MAIAKQKYSFDELMQAGIYDSLRFLCWSKTKDAQKGRNKPSSILSSLLDDDRGKQEEQEIQGYSSSEDFEKARQLIFNQ